MRPSRSGPPGRLLARSKRVCAAPAELDPIRATAAKLISVLSSYERPGAEQAGFLERWVATYIAELLDGEANSSGSERAKIRKEIVTAVPALWEQQLQRAALSLREELDSRHPHFQTADASTINLLRTVLANPSDAHVRAAGHQIDVMEWLIAAERTLADYLIEHRITHHVVAGRLSDIAVDVLTAFPRKDENTKRLHRSVFRLVPSLKKVGINDIEEIERIVSRTIDHILRARLAIAASLSEDAYAED